MKRLRTFVTSWEALLIVLLILAIILFLVSLMSDMLVERQATIIATLRSRGATRQHVFGAFGSHGAVPGCSQPLADDC